MGFHFSLSLKLSDKAETGSSAQFHSFPFPASTSTTLQTQEGDCYPLCIVILLVGPSWLLFFVWNSSVVAAGKLAMAKSGSSILQS